MHIYTNQNQFFLEEKIKYYSDDVILDMYNSLKDYSIETRRNIVQEARKRKILSYFKIVPEDYLIQDSFKDDKIEIDLLPKRAIKEFFSNLSLLEAKIPFNIKTPVFEPFAFNSDNIVEINKVAKKIAAFLGIKNYTFIVTPTSLDNKTAGIIEVNNQKEVFIEVSNEILKFTNILLATLVHEIAHKYLNILNVGYNDPAANERLTDLACIYFGFGKIMLNGLAESVHISNYIYSSKSGYLSLNEIAFILNIIYSRYNNSKKDLLEGLDGQKAYMVLKTNRRYNFFQKI